MKGRPPKPTRIKILEGNPGKRPLNKSEPTAGNKPKKPARFKGEKAKLWKECSDMLTDMRVLDRADSIALEMIVEVYCEWRTCLDWVSKHGSVYTTKTITGDKIVRQFPQVAQSSDAFKRMKSMLVEFGMTASARVRLGELDSGSNCLDMDAFLDAQWQRKCAY